MNLGDAFSHATKQETFQRSFHAGRILYLFCGFTKPAPKEKFIALGCTTPRPLVLVINSAVSEFIKRRPRMLALQIMIAKADHDSLDHDSYLNCSQAVEYFTQPIIERQVLGTMTRIKSVLTPDNTKEVIKAIEAAETITLRNKLWMLEALRETLT